MFADVKAPVRLKGHTVVTTKVLRGNAETRLGGMDYLWWLLKHAKPKMKVFLQVLTLAIVLR